MKKKKYISLMFILLLTIISFISIYLFKVNYVDNIKNNRNYIYESCINEIEQSEYCKEFLNEYNNYKKCLNDESYSCKEIVKEYESFGLNGISTLKEIYVYDDYVLVEVGVIFLFLIFISWYFSYDLNTLTIKNYLNRESYSKYIINIYKSGLKFCLSFMYILFILIIYSIIFSKDYSLFSDIGIYKNILYLILFGIFLINISFMCSVGNKNYVVSFSKCILVYLVFVFLSAQVSLFVRKFVELETINIFNLALKDNINLYLITGFILVIISSLVLYLMFRNKERIVYMLEKGDSDYED